MCRYDVLIIVSCGNDVISCFSFEGPKVVYVPPPPPEDENSIFSQFATGINFNKYDDISVDVSGSNPPKAILVSCWSSLCDRRI